MTYFLIIEPNEENRKAQFDAWRCARLHFDVSVSVVGAFVENVAEGQRVRNGGKPEAVFASVSEIVSVGPHWAHSPLFVTGLPFELELYKGLFPRQAVATIPRKKLALPYPWMEMIRMFRSVPPERRPFARDSRLWGMWIEKMDLASDCVMPVAQKRKLVPVAEVQRRLRLGS